MAALIRKSEEGYLFNIYVQPRAAKNAIAGIHGPALKIRLTAPPVDGAANKACRTFIAKLCKLPRSRVLLVAGETSRHKRLLLEGAGIDQVDALLQDLLGG